MIGGKYNRWIVILQEFDLEFMSAKSKKYLVSADLISELPCAEEIIHEESFPNEHLFHFFIRSLVWGYDYVSPDFEVSTHFFRR